MEIRHNSIFNLFECDLKNKLRTHKKWKNKIFQEFQIDYKISIKHKHGERVSNSEQIATWSLIFPGRKNKNIDKISLNFENFASHNIPIWPFN